MDRDEAIHANQSAMDELARISGELHTLDFLIVRFGQARWWNPELVRRLSRTKARLLEEREELMQVCAETRRYI